MDKAAQVIIFTGDGKGKTTAALGTALIYAMQGERVAVVQFLKGGGYSGELFSHRLVPGFTMRQFGHGCRQADTIRNGEGKCDYCGECFRENRNPAHDYAGQALAFAEDLLRQGQIGCLMLDEVSHAVRRGLVPLEKVIELVTGRPPGVTVIMTGRDMPDALTALADQATECHMVKHPMEDKGIDARRGIEY